METMMNRSIVTSAALAVCVAFSPVSSVFAQEKPSSGGSSTVVYVGGNDLVVKSIDGKMLNYTVPTGVKFAAGGKQVGLSELKPGTKLTAPIATGFDPQVVSAVAVVKGKVYAVTPPDGVTLLLREGVKELAVPTGTAFLVDGKSLKVSELKPDMMVEATIVTTGDAAATSASTAPAMVGALLVSKTAGADDMPAAATNLPLYGLIGLMMVALGFGLRRYGRKGVRTV
jgi:hypothetical protein